MLALSSDSLGPPLSVGHEKCPILPLLSGFYLVLLLPKVVCKIDHCFQVTKDGCRSWACPWLVSVIVSLFTWLGNWIAEQAKHLPKRHLSSELTVKNIFFRKNEEPGTEENYEPWKRQITIIESTQGSVEYVFLKNGPILGLSFVYFPSFQINSTNFTTNSCEKCPSTIRCWDSISWHLHHQSSPLTPRPGLRPSMKHVCHLNESNGDYKLSKRSKLRKNTCFNCC